MPDSLPHAPEDEVLVLGRLMEPYGVRGWLRLFPFGDDPASWGKIQKWQIKREPGAWQPVSVSRLKSHGDGWVVLLEEISDRTGAEALKGALLGASRGEMPTPEEDEFYWADLIGLRVVSCEGVFLGTVTDLIETGAKDVLVVSPEQCESVPVADRLIPFVSSIVLSVNLSDREIQVAWGEDW